MEQIQDKIREKEINCIEFGVFHIVQLEKLCLC